ncbi:MAG: MBL fold metallo-hydrolase, partial [Gammaproteobacteria bacterium]|nr:MBL fold metallo-hydrolase [Gammaproteobacteria bacterium]
LPPATTTNTIFIGTNPFYIVDPATPDEEEQQHLFDSVDARRNDGAEPAAILLTHHHADHVGAVTALSRRYQLPVRAHALCYDRIPPGFLPGEPLADGDRLELGTAPDGSDDWHLRVIETPGHASDHLCFQESRYQATVVGDMLSTLSTIVIDPPDGHLRTYLDSLQRLLEHDITTLYPAHGMPHPKGNTLIKSYLAHRKVREQQLIAALTNAPQTMHDILPTVYPEIPETIYPIALRSLLAGLTKLAEDGVAAESDRGWRLARQGLTQ